MLTPSPFNRCFVFLVSVLGFAGGSIAEELTHQKLVDESIRTPLRSVRWDAASFWGSRLQQSRNGVARSMTPLMLGSEKSHFVKNFRIAAGMELGKHRGAAWNDGDCYKWIEALSAYYAQSPEPTVRQILDEVVAIIAAAQRSDGYLHTPVLIASRNSQGDSSSLGDPANFEMYNMGHLMTAATVHLEATGDRSLLEVAIKAADYLDREFAKPDASRARHAICPAHYMGTLDLYRATGERRYLQLCQRWMSMRDLVDGGGDDNQDRVPFRQQREAVGHAVRANYLYAGAADLFLETKDASLLETLTSCWDSVHHRKIYVTGGCGALYDGASPDGSEKQKTITRIHQAYGRNYQLPNATAHNETCAAIGNVLWNNRMWQITRDAKYVDALENSLYNAVLAGVSLDGERFFYTNTLRQLDEMPTELRWPRQRQNWISCYCCPPNVARTIAQVGRFAYSVDTKETVVLLYGSNQLDIAIGDNQRLALQQMSDYPSQGLVRLQVKAAPSHPYSIGLRIPGWCDAAKIKINGQPHSLTPQPSSIASIQRQWQVGDTIELQLEMPVQYLEAHPLVEECRGQIAVRRGPLIYSIESNDLPAETRVQQISLAAGTEKLWSLEFGSDSIDSVPQLRGPLRVSTADESNTRNVAKNDAVALYRPYATTENKTISAKLIPYYAWGNRGLSEMSVWIPLQP